MKPVIFFVIVFTLLLACSKNKYATKPLLEIKNYSSKTISRGQTLNIGIKYYDNEGDLSGANFATRIIRLNKKPVSTSNNKLYLIQSSLPSFPTTQQGEINFSMDYNNLDRGASENDTLQFRFAVTDLGNNTSDSVTSQTVVIVK